MADSGWSVGLGSGRTSILDSLSRARQEGMQGCKSGLLGYHVLCCTQHSNDSKGASIRSRDVDAGHLE